MHILKYRKINLIVLITKKMHLKSNLIGKWAKDFNRNFIKEDVQMTNNHFQPLALGMDLLVVCLTYHKGKDFGHLGYRCDPSTMAERS